MLFIVQKEEEAKRFARDIETLQSEKERLTSHMTSLKQEIDNIRSTSDSRSDEFDKMKKKLDEETVKKQQVRDPPNMRCQTLFLLFMFVLRFV